MDNIIMIITDNTINLPHIEENIFFIRFYMINLSAQRFYFSI